MTDPDAQLFAHDADETNRVLIRLRGSKPGPALLVVGSLHGNEPAGRLAVARVSAQLHAASETENFGLECGDLMGVVGNLAALGIERRYIDSDLNRGWTEARLSELMMRGAQTAEEHEMKAIYELTLSFGASARGPLTLLDLHSTSGESPPFASITNLERDLDLVSTLPVPVVLGIDTHLHGTFLEYMQDHNYAGTVFEGGQHDDPLTVDHNEAVIWLLLEQQGMLVASSESIVGTRVRWAHEILECAGKALPSLLRIEYRYPLDTEAAMRPDPVLSNGSGSSADFRMCPGFRSFQEVQLGQLLAHHKDREIRSDRQGRILMPLYQAQGDDGFFLMSELA